MKVSFPVYRNISWPVNRSRRYPIATTLTNLPQLDFFNPNHSFYIVLF
jgi:hypothetical protein